MAGKAAKGKEIDPEVLQRRKFRAKCLFRALGRLVMANTYWLIEDVDEYKGVEDVKRRVQQAVRGKAKKKQLLSIKDKILLNKPADERTDQEKKYIYRIIGGLKCFKKYPNNVKKKLASRTYYKYYGPNRIIVKQHQEAYALYFIVAGEIIISQMIFDDLIQEHVSVTLGHLYAGDIFGEVSLLHNIPRTATCTTVGHCELLQLLKEDFKNVLQVSIQKQWDEVRHAMSAFTYFDALDEVALREGCIMAKMKSYKPNDVILGDGCGVHNFVYFILSGSCQMIESMQVIVTTRLGVNYYALYDPYVPEEESEQDFDKKYCGYFKSVNASSKSGSGSGPENRASGSGQEPIKATSQINVSKVTESTSIMKNSSVKQVKQSGVQIVEDREKQSSIGGMRQDRPSTIRSEAVILPPDLMPHRESVRLSVLPEKVEKPLPPNLKTYFMQVCQFIPGATFGFGENMRDRRIIALTPVECLLLPMIWLLQRNTANIWTRIQHYLDKKIPTKQQLFKDFVMARRWEEYKDQTVEEVLARSSTVNWTSVHDVPYSIRIEEMSDIY